MAGYDQPIIIKKVKKAAHAHHGGAWKIAYADFVTAMMAFFLLLWLISMTTPEQKQGLADYFAPPSVSESKSGSGGVLGGQTMAEKGAQTAEQKLDFAVAPESIETGEQDAAIGGRDGADFEAAKTSQTELRSSQDLVFHSAAASIRQAWQSVPDVTEIANNLLIEKTVEGLNIQIIDQAGRPMFPEGSKFPFEITRKAIAAVAPVLQRLPNQLKISGHTAAGSVYNDPRYGPWDLSTDRANVVRGILSEFGLTDSHFQAVVGRSTTEPLFLNDPYMAGNERIEITVLYEAPPVPPDLTP
jgi:chemotaxis protein MotB